MSAEPSPAPRLRTPRLVERDSELAELSHRLEAVRAGAGSVVVIEGPAGVGKSVLLDFACSRASDQEIRVLTGRGSEFEQAYPWGVVRALFAPALGGSDAERGRLLAGAARLADVALGLRPAPTDGLAVSPDAIGAALHGLYWALANLVGDEPLVMAVDDAQWADGPSLRWLRYLANRVEDLPVLLAIAFNPADRAGVEELPLPCPADAAALLAPGPLSQAGPDAWSRNTSERILRPSS